MYAFFKNKIGFERLTDYPFQKLVEFWDSNDPHTPDPSFTLP